MWNLIATALSGYVTMSQLGDYSGVCVSRDQHQREFIHRYIADVSPVPPHRVGVTRGGGFNDEDYRYHNNPVSRVAMQEINPIAQYNWFGQKLCPINHD